MDALDQGEMRDFANAVPAIRAAEKGRENCALFGPREVLLGTALPHDGAEPRLFWRLFSEIRDLRN